MLRIALLNGGGPVRFHKNALGLVPRYDGATFVLAWLGAHCSYCLHSSSRDSFSSLPAEREFLVKLQKGHDLSKYSDVYLRQLKHRILNKRKALTDDLLLVSAVLDKLQEL
jgi:hypothetical protein